MQTFISPTECRNSSCPASPLTLGMFGLFFFNILLFCVGWVLCHECMSEHYVCTVPLETIGGLRSPGTGVPDGCVTDACEVPYGCWELNPGPLQGQLELLTIKPQLQLLKLLSWFHLNHSLPE